MVIAKPAPLVSASSDAVDQVLCEPSPSHGRSARPRAWLACCVTAVRGTHAMCWARCARARLGTYALAAWSWMFRHRKRPWDELVVASGRVILRPSGLTWGSLVIDESDHQRSQSAKTLAPLSTLRDKESGGSVWEQRLVWLLVVTPDLPLPVGFPCSPPAPELSAWDKQEKALKKHHIPTPPRPPQPPPQPASPPQHALALRLFAQCQAPHAAVRGHCLTADALYGTATCVEGAAGLFGGVQGISQRRSHQKVRVHKRAQHVADSCATHPGTPPNIRLRGGDAGGAMVGSARWSVCSHSTKRCIVASTDAAEETSRSLLASDLTWRTLAIVQGHTLRWRVEGFVQDWQSPAGWSQWTKPPGAEGARRSVILSLLVDHGLVYHPDQHAQCKHTLPADPVGSLRAHGQVEGLVHVIETLLSSEAPQEQLLRCTRALHEVCAFNRSKKHMIQRQVGRLEPTPSLQYRADEVMRNIPALST